MCTLPHVLRCHSLQRYDACLARNLGLAVQSFYARLEMTPHRLLEHEVLSERPASPHHVIRYTFSEVARMKDLGRPLRRAHEVPDAGTALAADAA